jgi:hypothetical protein
MWKAVVGGLRSKGKNLSLYLKCETQNLSSKPQFCDKKSPTYQGMQVSLGSIFPALGERISPTNTF